MFNAVKDDPLRSSPRPVVFRERAEVQSEASRLHGGVRAHAVEHLSTHGGRIPPLVLGAAKVHRCEEQALPGVAEVDGQGPMHRPHKQQRRHNQNRRGGDLEGEEPTLPRAVAVCRSPPVRSTVIGSVRHTWRMGRRLKTAHVSRESKSPPPKTPPSVAKSTEAVGNP